MNLDGAPAGDLPAAFRQESRPSDREQKFQRQSTGGTNNNGGGKDSSREKGANARGTTREYRQARHWSPAFKQLFGGYPRKDREQLKLGAICRECKKSVQWISERLSLERGTCATSVVLGQCPPTCRLSIHDVNVDDTKAAEVATVLASAVKATAKAAGMKLP